MSKVMMKTKRKKKTLKEHVCKVRFCIKKKIKIFRCKHEVNKESEY